jgi:DNA-binding transcriptional LysR family regulator
MLDWGDIRVFLAVQREGSFSAGARALRIDQTTVGRRVAALESAVGARLFRRGRDGISLTTAGAEALKRGLRMEEEAAGFSRAVGSRDARPEGWLRLTTVESLAACFLAPRLPALRKLHPGITLELCADHRSLSLTRREADLAIRLARPAQPGLVTRRLATVGYALYGAPAYLTARPGLSPDLAEHEVLGYGDELSLTPEARWLAETARGSVALRSNSVLALREAAAAGLGLVPLPRWLGDADPRLRQAMPLPFTRELWLVVHRELRATALIRAVSQFLFAEARALQG